jgi:hypothetical protein
MPSEGAIILGSLAAFFFCMMFVSAGLKYYFKKKAEDDEANAKVESTWGPSSSSPGPAAASDVEDERAKLIKGTADKPGAKTIQLEEVDINVASPPSIPNPFTINTANDGDKSIDYTITFDIKVEKTLGREEVFTVLDRGGVADDSNGQRPVVQITSTTKSSQRCAKNTCELNGLEFLGDTGSCSPLANAAGCQKVTVYSVDKPNVLKFTHKPSLTMTAAVGPQAGEDFKNCTIVVKSTDANRSTVKMFWDGMAVGDPADSAGTDWGVLSSPWRWAGGQTAVNAIIGAVKVKNAYIFGRALDDDEVAVLLGRGASATSTYATEPKTVSWKFNPSGYESD